MGDALLGVYVFIGLVIGATWPIWLCLYLWG